MRIKVPEEHTQTRSVGWYQTKTFPSEDLKAWLDLHPLVIPDSANRRGLWLWFSDDLDYIEFKLTWL